METVTIESVETGARGWFNVTFEDGRTASTKDEALKDKAEEMLNEEVEVDIQTKTKGSFTNIYLNSIDGFKGKNGSGAKSSYGGTKSAFAPDPKRDERIARQWAYGRATELYAAGHPLVATDKDLTEIMALAERLLELSRPK